MNDTSTAPAYRVWKLAAAILDGAVLSVHTYTVKVERVGDTLTAAYVDGQAVRIERAAHLLTWAKNTGTVKQAEAFEAATLPWASPAPHAFTVSWPAWAWAMPTTTTPQALHWAAQWTASPP